ncbi:hypothetical protein HAX54_049136, partial [Datura stramonium]|nr:hypothetical protein [Datura stramonium]
VGGVELVNHGSRQGVVGSGHDSWSKVVRCKKLQRTSEELSKSFGQRNNAPTPITALDAPVSNKNTISNAHGNVA